MDEGALPAVPGAMPWAWAATSLGLAGETDRCLELCHRQLAIGDPVHYARANMVWLLAHINKCDEALELGAILVADAESTGSPLAHGLALEAWASAIAPTSAQAALDARAKALEVAQASGNVFLSDIVLRELAILEATDGDPRRALSWFELAIDSFHRAGNTPNVHAAVGALAMLANRYRLEEASAILAAAASTSEGTAALIPSLAGFVADRAASHGDSYDELSRRGEAMDRAELVAFAKGHLHQLEQLLDSGSTETS